MRHAILRIELLNFPGPVLKKRGHRDTDSHRSINLIRNPRHQTTQRRHLLRLHQLHLRLFERIQRLLQHGNYQRAKIYE